MSATDKIVLSVPPKIKYIQTVENFAEVITPHFDVSVNPNLIHELRSTLNEAFANVIRHVPADMDEPVIFTFELDQFELNIYFLDKGPGIRINDKIPPYPPDFINSAFKLLETIDGEVQASVLDENSLVLYFKKYVLEDIDKNDLLKRVNDGGMGLSIIIKLMDRVRFFYKQDVGNCMHITKTFYPLVNRRAG